MISGVVGVKMVVGWESVREEDGVVKRVRRVRIDGIGGENKDNDDERVDPCVPKREGFPSPQDRFRFPSLGGRTGGLCLRISLNEEVSQRNYGGAGTAGCIPVSKEES